MMDITSVGREVIDIFNVIFATRMNMVRAELKLVKTEREKGEEGGNPRIGAKNAVGF